MWPEEGGGRVREGGREKDRRERERDLVRVQRLNERERAATQCRLNGQSLRKTFETIK